MKNFVLNSSVWPVTHVAIIKRETRKSNAFVIKKFACILHVNNSKAYKPSPGRMMEAIKHSNKSIAIVTLNANSAYRLSLRRGILEMITLHEFITYMIA